MVEKVVKLWDGWNSWRDHWIVGGRGGMLDGWKGRKTIGRVIE